MRTLRSKKGIVTTIVALCVLLALPISAFASGAIVGRTTNAVSYKAAQSYFKMPDSLFLSSGTYPSIFYTIDDNASDGYYNLDFGLQYYNGAFRFQYFGGSTSPDGNVARPGGIFKTWSSTYGSWSCNVGDGTGCGSGTSGQSASVMSFSPSQVIRLDYNFVTSNGGSALEIDVYKMVSGTPTFVAQAILPVKDAYKNAALNSGARFNQQFNFVTSTADPAVYTKNGSYAFNAQFQNSYVITTSGTWVKLNNTNSTSHQEFEGYPSFPTSGKISYWSQDINGFTYDNIGYDFRP